MRYPKEISIILPLMTQMFSDDIHLGCTIKLGLIFILIHTFYVRSASALQMSLCYSAINLYEMLMLWLSYKFLPGRIS